jgi:hypothetical protein
VVVVALDFGDCTDLAAAAAVVAIDQVQVVEEIQVSAAAVVAKKEAEVYFP